MLRLHPITPRLPITPIANALPAAVAQSIDHHWPTTHHRVEPVVNAGSSVARIYRIRVGPTDHERSFALRSWGWSLDRRDRIDVILRFQSKLFEQSSSAPIIPEVLNWHCGRPVLEADGTFWTLSPWLAGQPIQSSQSITNNLLRQAVSTLAELHAIGSTLETRREIPLGLTKRCQCVLDWRDGSKRIALDNRLRQKKQQATSMEIERVWQPLLNAIAIGLFSFDAVHAAILHRTSDWLQTKRACHWIVGDLWRENILILDDRISGIVDFGAARVDWPALEVVRWLSSWLGPDDERLPSLLAEYASLRKVALERQGKREGEIGDEAFDPIDYRCLDKLCCLSAFLEWLSGISEDRFESGWLERKALPRVTELAARLNSMHC